MRASDFLVVRPVERGADGAGHVTYDVDLE
jgi:hypothetical protein